MDNFITIPVNLKLEPPLRLQIKIIRIREKHSDN